MKFPRMKRKLTQDLAQYKVFEGKTPKDMLLWLYETVNSLRVRYSYIDNLINHTQLIIYYFLLDLINTQQIPDWINDNEKVIRFVSLMDRLIIESKGSLSKPNDPTLTIIGLKSVLLGLVPELLDMTLDIEDIGDKDKNPDWAFYNYPNSKNR